MAKQLTPKQRAFVDEYLVDLNAAKAAIRAGYGAATARAESYKLLRKPHVAAAVEKALEARRLRTRITADRVLELLARMAFFDVRQLFDENGNLKPVAEWPEEAASAVAGVDVTELAGKAGVVRKVKFTDKRAAAVEIGKHIGMFSDKPDPKTPPKVELVVASPEPQNKPTETE